MKVPTRKLGVTPPTNAWDEIFKQRGRVFTKPHENLPRVVKLLKDKQASTVLDLGCGTGRHVVFLAKSGFSVFGLDNSTEGIRSTHRWLANEGLVADLRLQSMTEKLPYANDQFDAVISIQVIHHADITTIRSIVKEVERVLKSGGLLFITVPKLRNQGTTFEQIEPGTFIPLDGPEKGVPHHYFTPDELRCVFFRFEITDIHIDTLKHYCMSAFKQ
jgi:cyclopropane fatty-acyl-phospholipid synthase-like methyltransferase